MPILLSTGAIQAVTVGVNASPPSALLLTQNLLLTTLSEEAGNMVRAAPTPSAANNTAILALINQVRALNGNQAALTLGS